MRRSLAVMTLVALLFPAVGPVTAEEPRRGPPPDRFMGKSSAEVSADAVAASIPREGFQDEVVISGLTDPTVVRFAQDGRVFVAEKSGIIKVFPSLGSATPTVFADLRTRVHNYWDRGLLGMALHPAFPSQPYVYVLYTYDHILGDPAPAPRWGSAGSTSDPCPDPPGPTADGCVVSARLSRLQASGSQMTDQEQVLVEDWCQQYPSHSIGALHFGADGALYASAGDGASFTFTDHGQGGGTRPSTSNPVTPRNPCGDPPGGVGAQLTPPTAEGGALRSQDLQTRSSGGGATGAYRSEVLADSPAGYWRLGETTGTTAADASGNGRNGTYHGPTYSLGAAGLIEGDSDRAVSFTDGRVELPTALSPWSGDFTIEAWARPSQTSSYAALFSREVYLSNGFRLGQQGSRWAFWTTESGGSVSVVGGTAVVGQTQHIVVTRTGTAFRLYVDGVELANGTGTLVAPSGGGRIAQVGGAPFRGVVDEVAVYPRALSAARIAAHHQAGRGGGPSAVADPVGLDGTVIRIDPATGLGRPDNPLAGDPDPNAARIIGQGLRNPFRFAIRPGTNEVWLGDVGWSGSEEIDRIASPTAGVRNFGWPCYEGTAQQGSYRSQGLAICDALYAAGTAAAPYFAYRHSDRVVAGESCPTGSSSISGLAFYEGGSYPAAYTGALFFSDYSRNCIWAMRAGADGLPSTSSIETFVAAADNPVDLTIGPGGDLFYVDLSGRIHRIRYLSANQPPTASFTASPMTGPAPLTVSFDGRASSDPEGGALSYSWDLTGNGQFGDATTATPSYTYTQAGSYTVSLRVTDPQGASGTASRVIAVANDAPVPVISTPAASTRWSVGETIGFSGSATDPQDGTLPPSALRWDVILHHCPSTCHTHDIEQFTGVADGSFVAPDHDYPSHIELRLTATDSSGTSASASVELQPRTVDLRFESDPSGLQLSVGSRTETAPFTQRVIVGSRTSISAPSPQVVGGTTFTFASWSDGGARSHEVVAGSSDTTYRATFTGSTPEQADVSITKTGAPAASKLVRFTIDVRNAGPSPATAVRVSDTLVNQLTLSGTISTTVGSCAYAASVRRVTCELGTLAVGATARITFDASLTANPKSIDNTATVSTTTPDPNAANDSSTVRVTLR
jgi:uncharacterized repeat protein (TIGR01451 family)